MQVQGKKRRRKKMSELYQNIFAFSERIPKNLLRTKKKKLIIRLIKTTKIKQGKKVF